MSDTKLVMPEQGTARGRARAFDPSRAWAALGWIGLAFLVVGGADFALTWYPMDFGNREWEFGSVTASFNGLPILVLGLGLLLTSSVLTGRRWWALLAALVAFGLLVWIVVGVVLWITTVPLALQTVPIEVATGMKKAVAKTAVQSVVYPVLMAFIAMRALGAFRGRTGSGREG